MQPNLVTYFFLALGVVAFVAWLRERGSTELYATVAESLGMFLFTPADSATPIGCAPSPDPRKLYAYPPGSVPVMFEFPANRVLYVVFAVSGSLFGKRKRIDLVLTPGEGEGALHVTISADGRPPVFDGEVRFSEATKENPFHFGTP